MPLKSPRVVFVTKPLFSSEYFATKLHAEVPLAAAFVNSAARTKDLGELPPEERPVKAFERRLESAARARHMPDAATVSGYPCPVFEFESAKDTEFERQMAALEPDIILIKDAPILPEAVTRLARIAAINCHSSLLPRYRGACPEVWILQRRDTANAGVTVHLASDAVDTGAVVAIKATPLEAEDCLFDLIYKNLLTTLDIVPGALRALAGGTVRPTPQGPCAEPVYTRSMVTLDIRRELCRRHGYTE